MRFDKSLAACATGKSLEIYIVFFFCQLLVSTSSHEESDRFSKDDTMEVQSEVSSDSQLEIVEEWSEIIYTPTLNGHDYIYFGVPEVSSEEMLEAAQRRIKELEAVLEKQMLLVQLQMKPNSSIRFYTGFPSFEVLVATFRTLWPHAENMYSWSQMQRLRNRGMRVAEGLRFYIQTLYV